ncbi:adenylosuccinate lyase [Jeotgalibaca caeni]|uniref:adenylosuccinate lyase n=1 Tax=Jeotgalibaca caeni TaxID=3028623 RepID=UPI00237E9997|nr:adenylosuccinate lyase [Jeotgalibaca caeni]MDE1549225.1 adenylosuccinate lyase [Jeotgalibaca caeni]
MIERYALSPIKELWDLEAKYRKWLEVELGVIYAYEELGMCEPGTHAAAIAHAHIDVTEILAEEEIVNHDFIAFINCVTRPMGDEARYFHLGLTSSDVEDTATSLLLLDALELIYTSLEQYRTVLYEKAVQYKDTITIGRTHGIHGEPTSFGFKLLGYVSECDRNLERLTIIRESLSVGTLSGAVGNYANINPQVEEIALAQFGLRPTTVATQVIARDIHADFIHGLAMIASSIERMAVEIRHLQKTEVLEAQEGFKKGQRGSSAMPHKKNPILSERLTGLSRMVRAMVPVGYENIILWHERDISHSSTERFIFPDATQIVYYMTEKARELIGQLVVNEDRMLENIAASYELVYSQRVMLAFIEKGHSREMSYKLMQKNAMRAWDYRVSFKQCLLEDPEVTVVFSPAELDELFDPTFYIRNIDTVYRKFEDKV